MTPVQRGPSNAIEDADDNANEVHDDRRSRAEESSSGNHASQYSRAGLLFGSNKRKARESDRCDDANIDGQDIAVEDRARFDADDA